MEALVILSLILAYHVWSRWGRQYYYKQTIINLCSQTRHFSPDFFLIGHDGSAMAIQTSRKLIALSERCDSFRFYPFDDLISFEYTLSESQLSHTNRLSQLLLTAIAWPVFGEKGFIVGGTTASTSEHTLINDITLYLYLNDPKHPLHKIPLYSGKPLTRGSRSLRPHIENLNQTIAWLKLAKYQ